MPSNTWGHIFLHVQTLGKQQAEVFETEHRLIPDPAADHYITPSTVLMGTGRSRIVREIRGWTDRADWTQMLRDRFNRTARILTLEDGHAMLARIDRLEGNEDAATDTVWFVAEFREA